MRTSSLPLLFLLLLALGCSDAPPATEPTAVADPFLPTDEDLATDDLLGRAATYLDQPPVPLTNFRSERSQGGPNDFYSEGDYWWPDPDNPDGPYIRRDGKTNPDNFVAHRQAMRRLNEWVSTLVAAYQLTGERRYADHALRHLTAFFLDPATRMTPSLRYAQAIKGRVAGRGIGIIDTIHLIEVARAIEVLRDLGYLTGEPLAGLKDWFSTYANWLNTHPYGLDEKDHGNNHSTWWAAQLAAFARLTDDAPLLDIARAQFKKLLSAQMAAGGGFPDELERTKPYNYTLFNLEGYAALAEIASSPTEGLWTWQGEHGSLRTAWDFMLPFLDDKTAWPYPPDIQYYDQLPIRSPGLLLAARAYRDPEMMALWLRLDPGRQSEEVNRNFPLREPLLWLP